MPFPPPPKESQLGLGGRIQLLRSCSLGPTSCVTCPGNAVESALSGQGRREEKDSKSARESSGKSPNIPARPELISPLTQSPGLRAPGTGSQSRLATEPASPGGRERALRAIFGPNRHAPQIQAGGAGLEHKERKRERRGQGQARGGQGPPEGIKSGQEGARAPPATIELLLPPAQV